ncbi:putative transpeptidase [uncultured phage cr124_1]|uniref:Transpeptidase n=2 Tax=Caudoviricetes TaxID=2731619 RepID=A0A7M1RTQ3_9CAUD|nr:putative transpeptidase [uncultured phage cr124_1]QOR57504.1 putative transpeptidase [uncultured phage cr124_1]
MKLTLKRIALRPTYTIGKLYIDDVYFCDTIEDTVRDLNKNGKFDNGEKKVHSKTAIPYGIYEIKWTYSPRFKKYTPQLMNVPSFEGIRIHAGNTSADTEGCLILGKNKLVGKVLNSRATINKFYPIIKNACSNGKVTIEIK